LQGEGEEGSQYKHMAWKSLKFMVVMIARNESRLDPACFLTET